MNTTNVISAIGTADVSARSIDPGNPTNASTSMQGGQAVFENNNYRITADDNNTVTITNKHTGETYQAWGDPHMNIDGQHAFDFWGTTTFKLEDGTKVTIETTPLASDPSVTLSSKVTITNGDYGVKISGVDTNQVGDLKIDEAKGYGRVLDTVVSDGNVLNENPAGKGFVAIDRDGNVRAVDQNYINQTDLKKTGALQDQFKEAFAKLSSLLQIIFQGTFMSSLPQQATPENDGHQPVAPHPVTNTPLNPGHIHLDPHNGFDYGYDPYKYKMAGAVPEKQKEMVTFPVMLDKNNAELCK